MQKKHILVVSAGSVGKRHLRNLVALGCDVSAMDPREDRLEEAATQVDLRGRFTDFNKAMKKAEDFDGVVIGSPTKFHIKQAIHAVKVGLPVLLEKPLSKTYSESLQLQEVQGNIPYADTKVLLGYTWRWWPPLDIFRSKIKRGEIGKPLHAKFVMSAHLADWHPWESYQDFFMASKGLGGGALLDESHFIDLMIWLFGIPERVFAKVERISPLEIETDDNVDIFAFYDDSLRVTIHLDLYGRPHERFISVTGDDGTLFWSSDPNRIRFGRSMEQTWKEEYFQYERNDMFMNVAKEFLDIIEHKREPSCTVEDGVNVMRIIEACRESSRKEKAVKIDEID